MPTYSQMNTRIFGDTEVREPDFIDPIAGTAAWIGEHVAVEIDLTRNAAHLCALAGWYERTKTDPATVGVNVEPYLPGYLHPAASTKAEPFHWLALREAMQV